MSKHRPETEDQGLETDSSCVPQTGIAAARPRSLVSGLSSLVSRKAFTLLELLVAAAITAVLAGFVATIVTNVAGLWSRTSGRLSTEAQARFVLDQLSLDLSSARFQDDGNTWLAASILPNTNNATGLWLTSGTATNQKPPNTTTGAGASLQNVVTGSLGDNSATGPRFGIAGTWLRFFTTKRGSNTVSVTSNVTDSTTVSAPVAVGWQIIRRRTSTSPLSTDIRYLLHRVEVRPAKSNPTATANGTLETGYNITATAYAPTTNTAAAGDPGEIKFPTLNSVVAENVIDFGVRCFVRDATVPAGLRAVFPLTNAAATYSARTPSTVTNSTTAFPDVVDIMVRILTDEGARLIAAYEANPPSPAATALPTGVNPQQYWWQLALANSQVFTRRIVITAQPL